MSLNSFLTDLFSDGRVRVSQATQLEDLDIQAAGSLLTIYEQKYRDTLPGTPPDLNVSAAQYGAITLRRVCQLLVHRDLDADLMQSELQQMTRGDRHPSIHYSVDLTLRFLPDTFLMARAKSSADPLLDEIVKLAAVWPLSAVGIPEASDERADELMHDACLRGMYVDRIISRQDVQRLRNERVRAEAIQALGAFPDLAPAIAAQLDLTSDREREGMPHD